MSDGVRVDMAEPCCATLPLHASGFRLDSPDKGCTPILPASVIAQAAKPYMCVFCIFYINLPSKSVISGRSLYVRQSLTKR